MAKNRDSLGSLKLGKFQGGPEWGHTRQEFQLWTGPALLPGLPVAQAPSGQPSLGGGPLS